MKIIEFEMDGEPRATQRSAGSGQMKIIGLDDQKEQVRPRSLTGKDVGHIKIVEFDDDLHELPQRSTDAPLLVSRPMKIVEFDKDDSGIEDAVGSPKIKIKEFD